jgi:catechol 2,3-dioxygenase-like lactoylglutathione lyase family enzyme
LRSTDLRRARRFYADLLGFPMMLEAPNISVCLAGATAIAMRGPEAATPAGDAFDPFRICLGASDLMRRHQAS